MRSELTEEIVFDALLSVLQRGEYPSQASIRNELDTTASAQTLSGLTKLAYQRLGGESQPDGRPRIPHYVTQAVGRLHRDIAEQETMLASERVTEAEGQTQERQLQLDHARREHQETKEQMAYLRQEYDTLNEANDQVADRCRQLEERLESALGHNADLDNRLSTSRRDAARSIRQSRANAQGQIKALCDERGQLREELTWLKKYSEEERDRMLREVDSERQAHSKTKSALASEQKAHAETHELRREAESVHERTIADMKSQLSQIDTELTKFRDKAQDDERQIVQLQESANRLSGERDEALASLKVADAARAKAEAQRDIAQTRAEERLEQIRQLHYRDDQ